VSSTSARRCSFPNRYAAPPADAENSSASFGAPWRCPPRPHRVLDAPLDEAESDEHRLRAAARELEVGNVHVGADAERLHDHGAARLHGVGVRLRADVQRADQLRVDAGTLERRATGLDGDRDRVLVDAGNRLLLEQEPALDGGGILAPLARDLFRLDPIPGNERTVSDNPGHGHLEGPRAIPCCERAVGVKEDP
jgi:hypothetical protein